ncbi:MAG: ABC transporter permease subunit [Armatimonadetes bacterium]|nr:ABC transporter permease subunit [Armatimonadota bacterium]
MGVLKRLWMARQDLLDEAVAVVELRRYRRWLAHGWFPFIASVATLLIAWSGAPAAIPLVAGPGSDDPALISATAEWPYASLLVAVGLAAFVCGYLRSSQYWQSERRLNTFTAWLLTRQEPARSGATVVCMSAALALMLVAFPLAVMLVVASATYLAVWQVVLGLGMVVGCALLGASLGSAGFFAGAGLTRRFVIVTGALALAAVVLALWLRIEAVEDGWHRPWEEHAVRLGRAFALATPMPALLGVGVPTWWANQVARRLALPLSAWQGAMLYLALLLLTTAWATWVTGDGLARLHREPEASRDLSGPTPDLKEEPGTEVYWRGFRNPILTREIRTRLRSRDTAEFIFFASVAVAAGGFLPLFVSTRDLTDALRTADVARQVFFWLTMTLVALVVLITPGMAVDATSRERERDTLAVLVVSPLRARELLFGKLLGAVCVVALLVSPSLPLVALCFLFHGAEPVQIPLVYAVLGVALLMTGSLGVTMGAIHTRSLAAKIWTYLLTAVYAIMPGGPFWLAAAFALPDATTRQQLQESLPISLILAAIGLFVIRLLWGFATERLEYGEH